MATLQFDVPDDREAEVLAAVAQVLAAPPAPAPAAPLPALEWTEELAAEAVKTMRPAEKHLLFRVADARERRVAAAELSRDLGLPASVDTDRDFPALTAYCAAHRCAVPVVSGGDGGDAWYWMDATSGRMFRAVPELASV